MPQTRHLVDDDSRALFEYFTAAHRAKVEGWLNWALLGVTDALHYVARYWATSIMQMREYSAYMAMRKQMVEQSVRKFISEHPDAQVLVFGGGNDTMPLRLSLEFPNVKFFESDRGATRDNKLACLAKLRSDTLHPLHRYAVERENLKFIDIDAKDPEYKRKLASKGLKAERPLIVIMEGFAMYVPEDINRGILDCVDGLNNPNNRVLVGFLDKDSPMSSLFGLVLKPSQEWFEFIPTKVEGIAFINDARFEIVSKIGSQDLLDELELGYVHNMFHETYMLARPVENDPKQILDAIREMPVTAPKR